jgi:hypothetical protein
LLDVGDEYGLLDVLTGALLVVLVGYFWPQSAQPPPLAPCHSFHPPAKVV